MSAPTPLTLKGADGLRLAADAWGPEGARTVLMLHGGGQTRHSWKNTGAALAERGLRVVALDARGHGDSDRAPDGRYSPEAGRDDILAVLDQLAVPVTIVGASMGGLTGLLVARAAGPERVPGLVLVDIVPGYEKKGSARIRDFMRSAPDGFASLDEAAAAVAAYLPHRTRPRSSAGLRRNLRQHPDGRWRWHWDPVMMAGPQADPAQHSAALHEAAAALTIPVLLLYGLKSDVVSEQGVAAFRTLVPHAEVVPLAHAAHTAAGDDNDAFTQALVEFCTAGEAR